MVIRMFGKPVPKRGSFTVEAAMIVPFITLLIIACLFFAFFCHDSAVSQSYALRVSEREALKFAGTAAPEKGYGDGAPVCMSSITEEITKDQGSAPEAVFDLIKCRKTASCRINGNLDTSLLQGEADGISSFSCRVKVKRISYPDDMLLARLKSFAEKTD